MADNGGLAHKSKQSGRTTLVPIPLPNSQSGEAPPLISPIPSFCTNPPFFFAGARERDQTSVGLSIYIKKVSGLMLSFFSSDKREVGGDEDISEASEGSGHGSGFGKV